MSPVLNAVRDLPTTCLLVLSGGETVLEYGDATTPSYLASARKSVLSLLYGRPVSDGTIDLNSTLADLEIDDIGGLLPIERTATVRDLLTARSGVYHPSATPTPLDAGFPERGSTKPGTEFHYNNWDFNVLGTIFEQTTGRFVFDALAEDLAGPLGFQDFDPSRQRLLGQREKSRHLAHHMFVSGRDLARVGLLVTRIGLWNEKQLIPAGWLDESTTPHVPHFMDFGYCWWLPRLPQGNAVMAAGNFGQIMLVLPGQDLVIVHRVAVPDDVVIARSRGAEVNVDGVTLRQFMPLAQLILRQFPRVSP